MYINDFNHYLKLLILCAISIHSALYILKTLYTLKTLANNKKLDCL